MANGDWQCPNTSCINHTKLVFAAKATCPKCGSSPAGVAGGANGVSGGANGERPEDWQCPKPDCINHNKMVFGKHSSCPACGTGKNAQKPGDWNCPNRQCLNHTNTVFGSKSMCPKCGSPRPPTGRGGGTPMFMPTPATQAMHPMMVMQQAINSLAQMGDWKCPNASCTNSHKLVFGRHSSCPLCGIAKPATPAFPTMPAMGMMQGGKGVPRSDDWQCPNTDCQNHRTFVFAKNSECPKCGTPKSSASRTASGKNPNDWQCPNQECMNSKRMVFGKHASCPQCGSDKPAAQSGRYAPY